VRRRVRRSHGDRVRDEDPLALGAGEHVAIDQAEERVEIDTAEVGLDLVDVLARDRSGALVAGVLARRWPKHSEPPASSPRRRARSRPPWPSPHRRARSASTPTFAASTATCSLRPAAPPTRRPPAITAPSPSPASRARARSSCAPRRASRACGGIRASAPKRATSSPRSTAGSPRASTRAISSRRRRCCGSYRDRERPRPQLTDRQVAIRCDARCGRASVGRSRLRRGRRTRNPANLHARGSGAIRTSVSPTSPCATARVRGAPWQRARRSRCVKEIADLGDRFAVLEAVGEDAER